MTRPSAEDGGQYDASCRRAVYGGPVIRQLHNCVDFWKIGKRNHNKEVDSRLDWPKFRFNVERLLDEVNGKYYIKEDLRNVS